MKAINVIKFFIFCFFGAIIFISGFYFGQKERIFVNPSDELDFSLFTEAYYLLQENFPGFEDVNEKEKIHGIIRGLVGSLGDAHTSFFDKEESKIFLDDVSGEFEGIGIEIGIRENKLRVISPLKNTPADRAGLRPMDIITKIDGESTTGITIEEAVQKIRGERGEEVVLEISRNEEKKDVSIVRDTIKIPSLSWEIIEDDIAYIELFHFHGNITRDFSTLSREIIESPAKKIILDLRNNPGGLLGASVDISSYFIEKGDVVVIKTRALKNDDQDLLRAKDARPTLKSYPITVLINEGSASASEILAGALRDNRDIRLVGMPSFGKGSIQAIHTLEDGSTLKITEEYFLTPGGNIIDEEGLMPDIKIEITEEDIEKGRDPQLEKAIEVIREEG